MAQSTQLSIATLNTVTKSTFARHETFHPRFGWLKKGFDRAAANPAVFRAEDATVQLGVGKNMVRSIRYWCSAFKLLEDDRPTAFGQKLLGENGWDSYLEDPASLWLLHWKLLEEPCSATAWKIVFNEVNKPEFTEDEILEILERYRGGNTAISSFKKDVSCLLRMYVKQTRSQKSLVSEESLDCPFVELGLIDRFEDNQVKRSYRFRLGYKLTLVSEVIVYAALQYAQQINESARTIPLARLLYDSGSPGQVFKLTESALCSAIESVARNYESLSLEDAAGKIQLSFSDPNPLSLAEVVLDNYFSAR